MVRASFDHICNCDSDTLWRRVMWDEEFNRRLFLDELRFSQFEVLRFHENQAEVHRITEGVASLTREAPPAFQKFVNRGLGYRQTDLFDKRTLSCRTTVVPKLFGRRLSIVVTVRTEPDGSRCRCLVSMDVTAKIFVALGGTSAYGVGSVLEAEVIEHLLHGFRIRAEFTNRFLAEKAIALIPA